VDNTFGEGIGALISQGGEDKSLAQVMAPNILAFLESHYQKLTTDFYFSQRGFIESYCA
jgi:hypothetical protein